MFRNPYDRFHFFVNWESKYYTIYIVGVDHSKDGCVENRDIFSEANINKWKK